MICSASEIYLSDAGIHEPKNGGLYHGLADLDEAYCCGRLTIHERLAGWGEMTHHVSLDGHHYHVRIVAIPGHEACAEQHAAEAAAWQATPLSADQRKATDADQAEVAKAFGWTE